MATPLMPDFTRWSDQELHRAEHAAVDFLNSNVTAIANTFEKRLKLIRKVNERLKSDIDFEERMMCLSMIQELSQGLEESAREFFEIGCQPRVAKMVKHLG